MLETTNNVLSVPRGRAELRSAHGPAPPPPTRVLPSAQHEPNTAWQGFSASAPPPKGWTARVCDSEHSSPGHTGHRAARGGHTWTRPLSLTKCSRVSSRCPLAGELGLLLPALWPLAWVCCPPHLDTRVLAIWAGEGVFTVG